MHPPTLTPTPHLLFKSTSHLYEHSSQEKLGTPIFWAERQIFHLGQMI